MAVPQAGTALLVPTGGVSCASLVVIAASLSRLQVEGLSRQRRLARRVADAQVQVDLGNLDVPVQGTRARVLDGHRGARRAARKHQGSHRQPE